MKDDERLLNDEQILLSFISLLTIIVSITLLFNDRLKAINKEFICNKKEYYISVFNRIIILIVFSCFLILNYKGYLKAKNEQKKNIDLYYLQVISSIFLVISALITLYVAYKDVNNLNVDLENPVI